MFRDEMKKAAEDFGLTLSENQLAQFTRYYELLVEWNEKMNLTAITEEHEVAIKHMVDSLSAYDSALFDGKISIIDVGTGAGFPGLPLKIFCPQVHLTLMDSLNKRVNFLQTVVDELGLEDVDCVHARAEEGARMKKYREQYDLAVSRAVARLPVCRSSSAAATSSHSRAGRMPRKSRKRRKPSKSWAAATLMCAKSICLALMTSAPSSP